MPVYPTLQHIRSNFSHIMGKSVSYLHTP